MPDTGTSWTTKSECGQSKFLVNSKWREKSHSVSHVVNCLLNSKSKITWLEIILLGITFLNYAGSTCGYFSLLKCSHRVCLKPTGKASYSQEKFSCGCSKRIHLWHRRAGVFLNLNKTFDPTPSCVTVTPSHDQECQRPWQQIILFMRRGWLFSLSQHFCTSFSGLKL